jgi:3',5'-cyclic AMP phosphodiesterase CpdA
MLNGGGHTRREALVELTLGAAALALAGCGRQAARVAAANGSTLRSSYIDPRADGLLTPGPGVALIDRTELAPAAPAAAVRCTLAHLTDAHVMDEQSPARVPFLRRLGAPFNSTFRPQEALSAHVMAGAVRAIDLLAPDAVIQGGDLIDNAQSNELVQALALLRGGSVYPNSGGPGYTGVQSAADPDPFYYRPDIDAPRHPGMLQAATRRFDAPGLRAPWYPVLGDHDLLVQGVLAPSPLTGEIAVGARAVWDLPASLKLPSGALGGGAAAGLGAAPDDLADPAAIAGLIEQLRLAPSVSVAADPTRRQLAAPEVLAGLRSASGVGGSGPLLDYSFDVGSRVRVIVLDLVRREGGSGGIVQRGQEAWLAAELARAHGRWVIVCSHQPLTSTAGAERLLALLDRDPRVLAAICGHTHRNSILPRASAAGGYWLIATCSLIDYPQQLRAIRVRDAVGGGCVLETWMIDHVPDGGLGDISRELSYFDAQGGRPQGFAGGPLDRNVRLYKR